MPRDTALAPALAELWEASELTVSKFRVQGLNLHRGDGGGVCMMSKITLRISKPKPIESLRSHPF